MFSGLNTEAYDRTYTDRQLVRRVASYFARDRRRLLWTLVTIVLLAVISAVQPLIVSQGINLLGEEADPAALWALVWISLLIGLLFWGVNWLRRRLLARVTGMVMSDLRVDAFEAVIGHDMSFFDQFRTGRIISRITTDTQEFSQVVVLIVDIISQMLSLVILAVILFRISWQLTVVVLLSSLAITLVAYSLRNLARRVTRSGFQAIAEVNAAIQEAVTGISVAKNFRQEAAIYGDFLQVNSKSYDINLRRGFMLSNVFPILNMVGELDVQQRVNIVQLLVAVQQHDVLSMAQVLKNLSTPFRGPVDEKAYYKDFERKVGRIMYMGTSLDFGQVVNSGLNLLREHGLRLDPNLTMAIKTLMQAEAIATTLFPEGGIVADGVQMVREELMQVVTADRMLEEGRKQLTAIARDALQQVPSLSVATASWLNQYRKGRFEVYVDTSALAKEVNKISSFGRQAVIAIILVGMIIGSAIATSVAATAPDGSATWSTITRLAYLGYIFAMVIAMVIVLRLVWRWLKGKAADED